MTFLQAGPWRLEPQRAVHAREMFDVLSDPAIYEFENAPPPSPAWLEQRFARLEAGVSPDGAQKWLNWVIRTPSGALAGYVQATVQASGCALIGYELGSAHWRQGMGSRCVDRMIGALRAEPGVHTVVAVLKAANHRSLGLLQKLGFLPADASVRTEHGAEADEQVMLLRL